MSEKETSREKGSFEIRSAEPRDAEVFAEIYAQSWRDNYVNDEAGITREDIEEHVEKKFLTDNFINYGRERLGIEFENKLTRVVESEGKVIGLSRWERNGDGTGRLSEIHILKGHGGRGIGRALMEDGLNWLGDVASISLQVVSYNHDAIGFYEKYGFVVDPSVAQDGFKLVGGKIVPQTTMIKVLRNR